MAIDTASCGKAEAVTPSDETSFARATRALWVGGAGDVAVEMASGGTAVFVAVPAGSLLPVRVTRVNDTDTDATSIVALW